MDDTQQSRTSDAAATRKRRSSILKSQRPARTPFSELEFNVATPTDTAKSRRVSFSRRTGVAEFVTNEATTTWKNFYEEHNKSLESSGNDSELNAQRQPIEHLGRRIFDQQFEEVEAVDFVGNLTPSISANASLNNINFAQQIESVETADGKISAPHNKFELSALTDQQSKLFGNDFTVTGVGELSGKIDFNFSNIQNIGERDDLEDIERDLERVVTNVVCQGPADRHNISEYIEVDLNMTHVARSDDCDMSITDTVSSPKVQDVSKSSSIDKKVNLEKDWMTDKENIAVNPYAPPREADNFAVNDEPNQVLVFDGKRLTIQTEKSDKDRHTMLPNPSKESSGRKNIVLNTNDDLPNFIDDVSIKSDAERSSMVYHDRHDVCVQAVHKVEISKKRSILGSSGNISITQSLPTNNVNDTNENQQTITHKEIKADNISIVQSIDGQIITDSNRSFGRRRTVVYENETGNISITQALPTNVLQNVKSGKRKTIVFEEDGNNISVTQGLMSQVILDKNTTEKRKTIVFDEGNANVSITQALPSQVILNQKVPEKRKTIVFDEDNANISITQALPSQVILNQKVSEKRKTIVFDEDNANISMTQALPSQVILNQKVPEKRKTIVFDEDNANISMTQALPSQVILNQKVPEKRKTIVFDEDNANISMTQALPSQVILNQKVPEKRKTIVFDDESGNISITQALPTNIVLESQQEKRKTYIYEDNTGNISITQEAPANLILSANLGATDRRRTIVYEDDTGNISVTQTLPQNIILGKTEPAEITQMFDAGNISMTQALPTNIILKDSCTNKRRTIVYDDETGNISITQAIPSQLLTEIKSTENDTASEDDGLKQSTSVSTDTVYRRRTVIYDDEASDISMTQSIPGNILILNQGGDEKEQNEYTYKEETIVFEDDMCEVSSVEKVPAGVFLLSGMNSSSDERFRFTEEESEEAIDRQISTQVFTSPKSDACIEKRRTVVFADENCETEISIMDAIPNLQNLQESCRLTDKGNLLLKKPIPDEIIYAIRTNIINKSVEKEPELSEQANVSSQNVVVYQSATSKPSLNKIEQGDSNSDFTVDRESNATASIKAGENDVIESLGSKNPSLASPVLSKDQVISPISKNASFASQGISKDQVIPPISKNASFASQGISKDQVIPPISKHASFVSQVLSKDQVIPPISKHASLASQVLSKDQVIPPISKHASLASQVLSKDPVSPPISKHASLASQVLSKDPVSPPISKNASLALQVQKDRVTPPISRNSSLAVQVISKDQVISPTSEIIAVKTDVPNTESETTHSIANDPIIVQASKTSVLHNLLDMSEPIINAVDDKSAGTNFDPLPAEPEPEPSKGSSMLYLIIDEDREVQTDKVESDKDAESTESKTDTYQIIGNSPLPIEYKELEELEEDYKEPEEPEQDYKESEEFEQTSLQNALTELVEKRDKIKERSSPTASINVRDEETTRFRSIKEANDTKELLDMICDFTDHSRCSSKEAALSLSPVPVENRMEEAQEPRRLSFATRRQSIIISREDLLNNMSMAQAVLQKSRLHLDDTSLSEDKQDSSMEDQDSPEEDHQNLSKKSARLSNEVVKTLHFDDESVSDNSLKNDFSKLSPLKKKTTFGETSFVSDNTRTRVIPSYLKDVSDGIKQLMSDLVKPLSSDAIPFENNDDRRVKRTMSTVSTQIQANLITSSQIDMDTELSSDPASRENMDSNPYYHIQNAKLMPVSSEDATELSSDTNVRKSYQPCLQQNGPAHVLVFDHNNPLNNILLGPLDYQYAHEYQPIRTENLVKKSEETLCGSERSESCQINMEIDSSSTDSDAMSAGAKDVETETVIAQCCTAGGRQENRLFHIPTSKDRAVDVHSEVEHIEVNTVIAMKPNRELLETSSSLTLIDDAESVPQTESISGSSQYFIAKKKERISSIIRSEDTSVAATDITTTDDSIDRMKTKGKKRSHIPATPNRRTSIDITPKPNSKMLKISDSPNPNRLLLHISHDSTKMPAERDTEDIEDQVVKDTDDKSKTEKNTPNRSYNSTITIQQLLTDYQIDAGTNKEILDVLKDTEYCKSGSVTTDFSSKSESVTSDSIDKVCSFTSSKNHGSMKNAHSAVSPKSESTIQSSECARIDWHPELSSLAATKDVSYYDSGVNIVSKIDMLPFMGSHECERESSSADTWSFRLLHGRIRLMVRLVHRHDNATRTRVRADTPVTDVSVDTIEYDKKNPVAILCIRYACETMRYMVSCAGEGVFLARDVPLLLRRCAAVARVALRWGRAMHDARLHLAYALDTEGHLALKVANIPLRSVWEVRMDLELVVEHAAQAPWPRAGNVRVTRVVSDVRVSDGDVRRALRHTPNDWGHAPKTLWRMFRYLKHRQRDDNELLLGV